MSVLNKRTTPAEIAAIYYHVFSGCEDWRLLYAIADGITDPKQIDNINRSSVYKWKSSAKITALLEDITRRKYELQNAAIERVRGEIRAEIMNAARDNERPENGESGSRSGFVDYSRPENQTAKLNELVNRSKDPGEALDALKVIISTQKADRDAAKEGRVQRVYLPITCDGCPLYQRARKRAENK